MKREAVGILGSNSIKLNWSNRMSVGRQSSQVMSIHLYHFRRKQIVNVISSLLPEETFRLPSGPR